MKTETLKYCSECKYYEPGTRTEFHYGPNECWHPQSIKKESYHFPSSPAHRPWTETKTKPGKADEINANNNCQLFEGCVAFYGPFAWLKYAKAYIGGTQ